MVSKAGRSVNVIMTLSYVKGRLGVHVKTRSPSLGGVLHTQSNQEGWVVESPQGRLSVHILSTVDETGSDSGRGISREMRVHISHTHSPSLSLLL